MICTISKHEAEREGYQDAMMLDYRGQLAEATGANVFLVQNGELHTPKPDCFLNGLTRQTVIELAKRRQIKVVERAIQPEELGKTDEVFLVGSAAEVTPVGEIGDYKFTPGAGDQADARRLPEGSGRRLIAALGSSNAATAGAIVPALFIYGPLPPAVAARFQAKSWSAKRS